jgi:enoyl-CoA hydratase/carnithine racemase
MANSTCAEPRWIEGETAVTQADGERSPSVLLAVDGESHIATLTLNRPEALNAISRQLAAELLATCDLLTERADVWAVIVTGAGERAFCAGADLKERRLLAPDERAAHTAAIEAAAEALAALPMPTIAAVRGFALAGGAELAIACDLRVAADDATFGFPEVKIGIFPGAGGALRLPRIVGGGAARDLLFTGRRLAAEEAFRLGLVDRLVSAEAVLEAANVLAVSIAANAPLAVRAVKRALEESHSAPPAEARRAVNALRVELDATADYEEGLAAFAERRAPRFSGH